MPRHLTDISLARAFSLVLGLMEAYLEGRCRRGCLHTAKA